MSRLIYVCSSNTAKLREFELAAQSQPALALTILPLPGLPGIVPPSENGTTFEENATLKARHYSRLTPEWVFADDSGLEVDALSGGPGIYSARFAGSASNDTANNQLLLRRLSGVENRTARFTCVLALARSGEVKQTFRASVEGSILEAIQGDNGFGYDPLFYHLASARSFGQLTPDEKLKLSHRGQAARQLFAWMGDEFSGGLTSHLHFFAKLQNSARTRSP